MRKIFNKIKAGLVAFWIALITFPFKANGLSVRIERSQPDYGIYYPQELYGVPSPIETKPITANVDTIATVDTIIKITPRLLVVITFIVGIVNFIKIRKIDDKAVKKKKINGTIYVMIILIILIIICFRLSTQLKRKF